MPFKLGPLELVLILAIIFIIFGAGKLPQIFGSIGKSMRAFRESQQSKMDEEEAEDKPVRKTRKASKKAAASAK
jgi:sec-independent protein translocase protein TatA